MTSSVGNYKNSNINNSNEFYSYRKIPTNNNKRSERLKSITIVDNKSI